MLATHLPDIKLYHTSEKKKNKCANAQSSVSFGLWNVRLCVKQLNKGLVIRRLKEYQIQAATLSEKCMHDSRVKLINDYNMIYSSLSSTNKIRSAHGVALSLNQNAARIRKNSESNWKAKSERILKIRLKCTPINITVLSVYSPDNPTDKQMIKSSEKFYDDLQDTLNKISTDDMIIIMGDLNF